MAAFRRIQPHIFCLLLISLVLLLPLSHAFTRVPFFAARPSLSLSESRRVIAPLSVSSSPSSLIVISPPGGVGEVAAVQAATMGMDVRWFVVSSKDATTMKTNTGNTAASAAAVGQQELVLSQYALDEIEAAGGSVQLAGADAASLLLPADDAESAIRAVSAWCGPADSILCTLDGMDQAMAAAAAASFGRKRKDGSIEELKMDWKNAIKLAAKQASGAVTGTKIAVLAASEKETDESDSDASKEGLLGGVIGNLLGGGNKPSIPASLSSALSSSDSSRVVKLRHGELFGIPESSPDFSALVGGPRRVPELCEEYTMRSVRVDPTVSLSGNLLIGSNVRTSRRAVGEAAALMASGKVSVAFDKSRNGLDVCVSSQLGSDSVPLDLWIKEFQRVEQMLSTSSSSSSSSSGQQAALLFSAEFSSVPDVSRLADWLATKWAPAVLRTYDIAGIRIGARPVYATRMDNDNKVEIVWQQLVNFESVNVGKMIIQVTDTGLVATRGAGDAASGFGSVSSVPLAGEDVLVRRLAEAVSQAIEKGLANKPLPTRRPKEAPKAPPVEVAPVTSIQSSGTVSTATVAATAVAAPPVVAPVSDQGPRQSGARRSKKRDRGTRKADKPPATN